MTLPRDATRSAAIPPPFTESARRSWAPLGLALALLLSALPSRALSDAPAAPVPPPPAPAARPPVLGLQLGLGFPDGAALSAVYRPWYFLRLNAGPTYNYLAYGVQGGATLVAAHFPITPTLTGEGGYFFPGNVNARLAHFNINAPAGIQPLLTDAGYSYLSTQLGFEVGAPDTFVFFLRFGLAWLYPKATGVASSQSNTTSITVNGLQGRIAIPTANLGFIIYVW